MTTNDRRSDSTTSMKIAFALRIKKAFGHDVAMTFTESQRLEENLAKAILQEDDDRRQAARRINQRSIPRKIVTTPR
ncbi:MAG: hypothetical protein V4723_00445 [Pseudomonadota bacterium]